MNFFFPWKYHRFPIYEALFQIGNSPFSQSQAFPLSSMKPIESRYTLTINGEQLNPMNAQLAGWYGMAHTYLPGLKVDASRRAGQGWSIIMTFQKGPRRHHLGANVESAPIVVVFFFFSFSFLSFSLPRPLSLSLSFLQYLAFFTFRNRLASSVPSILILFRFYGCI